MTTLHYYDGEPGLELLTEYEFTWARKGYFNGGVERYFYGCKNPTTGKSFNELIITGIIIKDLPPDMVIILSLKGIEVKPVDKSAVDITIRRHFNL